MMMSRPSSSVLLLLLLSLLCVLSLSVGHDLPAHHSFGPLSPSNRRTSLPFFELQAGAKFESEKGKGLVRLTPPKQSRTGALWNTVPVTMSEWEITLEFQVTGKQDMVSWGKTLAIRNE